MTRFHHDTFIPEVYDHLVEEPKIIKFWHKEKIFEKLKKSRREKNEGKFSYHSAPVSCSGHPHSGQILNSLIKDVLKRYGYQKNFRVESTFRWDGHSLPNQLKVDNNLGITHHQNLKKTDLELYNEYCRAVGEEYIAEWKLVFGRLGNCVDSPKQYSTSDTRYMEGVWKVFKRLYDKGLIYQDTKTLLYSTSCSTHLTNFEAEQNLKEVSEIGFTIALNIVDSREKLLIWTTNPWVLAFDSGLCLNPKAEYVRVKVGEQIYILSKKSLEVIFENPSEYTVLEEVMGESLAEIKCEPLFENVPLSTGYRIYTNSSLSNDGGGTGITGSDDFAFELLKNGNILNTKEIKYKKAHCSKSGAPLVRKRFQSWFIRVEDIIDDFQKNVDSIDWHPEGQVSGKDSVKWIEEHLAQSPISRIGNWGTPLPLWTSASGDEIVCVQSLEELKTLSGKRDIPDLHRQIIDSIQIPSKIPGNPPLRRVSDVFDCWFESGALPFIWEKSDQADFVAESIAQTRGWLYTTVVLATALSHPPPFHNVIAHGLTLESNGLKVQKRKHNRNDSMRLCSKYGADAFRLYMLNCSHHNFIVEEEGVAKMAETVIQPLFRIFLKCTNQMGNPRWINYACITTGFYQDPIDQWILSCSESTLKLYIEEMNAYRIYSFLPKVIELIAQIENWYIPLRCPKPNRKCTETESNSSSVHRSTCVLFDVIYKLCLVLAPVAPFLTEFIFQIHKEWMYYLLREETMHAASIFEPNCNFIKPDHEQTIQRMQNIVKSVRLLRGQYMIPSQYLIQEVVVIHHSEEFRERIAAVAKYFLKLMNAQDLRVSNDHREFGILMNLNVKQNSYSKKKEVILKNLNEEELNLLMKGEDIEKEIKPEEVVISYKIPKDTVSNIAIACNEDLIVVIKLKKSLLFYEEGTVKELVHQIRSLKKRKNYHPKDCVLINYSTEEECLKNVIAKYGKHLNLTASCDLRCNQDPNIPSKEQTYLEEQIMVKGATINMFLEVKKCE